MHPTVSRLNWKWCSLAAAVLVCLAAFAGRSLAEESRVELEVITQRGFAITGAQAWARVLGEAGFENLRIRPAEASEKLRPKIDGQPGDRSRKVTGVLTSGNVLLLPDARFGISDQEGMKAWLKQVQSGREQDAPPAAFGLTSAELVDLHTQLSRRIPFETKGQPAAAVAGKIARLLPVSIIVDEAAKRAIAADDPVRDELLGLSCGTALAAIVRPAGAGFAPTKDGGQIRLRVAPFAQLPEAWPVGWPPEEKEADLVPDLLKFLEVEINDTPIADTVAAIAGRLQLPVLYDHNALARHRIDPRAEKTSLPEMRTYYRRILDRTLIPSGMRAEVRVDEENKPFFWIATVKP